MTNHQKELQNKQPKSLLDFILLQLLDAQLMPAHQLAMSIYQIFGLHIDPNIIIGVIAALKSQGFVRGKADLDFAKPSGQFRLTLEGRNMLTYAESRLVATTRQLSV